MRRPRILPLPGNNAREGSFYQEQPIASGVAIEWPGGTSGPDFDERPRPIDRPDPSPFKLGGM